MASSDPQPSPGEAPPEIGLLNAVSNEMVAIYKSQFGRGPEKVRAQWAGGDALVVILEKTFTPVERTLRALGEHERLRELRLLFQYAERQRFCAPIERLTGRRVRAFISGIDTEADVATEMFVLDPIGEDGASPAEIRGVR
jgi:uncharacterized protein YbcI